MKLQIIQDSKGVATGVFIPMDNWAIIKSSYPNVEKLDEDNSKQLSLAADALQQDYLTNDELTIFTQLDIEDFYEAR